jgi:hypothetical protein
VAADAVTAVAASAATEAAAAAAGTAAATTRRDPRDKTRGSRPREIWDARSGDGTSARHPRRATSPERARTHTRRVDAEDDARGEEAARAPTAADASAEDAMALLTFAGEAKREMWLCCGGENA